MGFWQRAAEGNLSGSFRMHAIPPSLHTMKREVEYGKSDRLGTDRDAWDVGRDGRRRGNGVPVLLEYWKVKALS